MIDDMYLHPKKDGAYMLCFRRVEDELLSGTLEKDHRLFLGKNIKQFHVATCMLTHEIMCSSAVERRKQKKARKKKKKLSQKERQSLMTQRVQCSMCAVTLEASGNLRKRLNEIRRHLKTYLSVPESMRRKFSATNKLVLERRYLVALTLKTKTDKLCKAMDHADSL